MKKSSDDLFRLIKSLTKSEKGYFKKFAKRYSGPENNSLKLYDAVEKQAESKDEYDEEVIKKSHAKETFVKQLAVTKIYLYNLILKSLDQYYSEENERARLNELISQIKILERKTLYKQCYKLLKKAKEIAYRHEVMPKILELLVIEKNLIMTGLAKTQAESREESYKEQKEFLKSLDNYFEYNWISDRMVILAEQRSEINEAERLEEIEKIGKSPLLVSVDNAITDFSKGHFYNTKILYCISKNDFSGAQELLKKQIELSEKNPGRLNEHPRNYIIYLINYILFSNIAGKEEDARAGIGKLEKMRNKFRDKLSRNFQVTISALAVNTEILLNNQSGRVSDGKHTAAKAENVLNEYEDEMPYETRITLLYNLSKHYFLAQDYDNALRVMNLLLNSFTGDVKPEIFSFAKILNLVIHLELQHNELLEYIGETTYRFLKDRQRLSKSETLFIKLLKEILRSKNKAEITEAFKEFKYNVLKVQNEGAESKVFQYFEFVPWAESKITGRLMAEVLADYKRDAR